MSLIDGLVFGFQPTWSNILFVIFTFAVSWIFLSLAVTLTSPLAKIPSAPGLPILRQSSLILSAPDIVALFVGWMHMFRDVKIFKYSHVLGPTRVTIFDPAFIKQVLVTNATKYEVTDIVKSTLPNVGNGVFSANGYDHSWQRKLMNPLFTSTSINRYAHCIDKHAQELVQVWSDKCLLREGYEEKIIVQHDLSHFTLDVFGDTALGYQFKTVVNNDSEISSAFEMMLKGRLVSSYILANSLIPFYQYLPLPVNITFNRCRKLTDTLIDKVIDNKRESLDSSPDIAENSNKVDDLLTVMMKACDEESGKKMTTQLLKDNLWTLLIAGHDTTSVALTWTLYHLANNQDVQEKAREEAVKVIGKSDCVTTEMIDQLEFITCVIKESLRITPPGGIVIKRCIKRDKLGNYDIPKGTLVVVPIFALHRFDEFWPEPDQFKPERFLDSSNYMRIQSYTYLPFSGGPRTCLGVKLAMMELKIALSRILLSLRFNIAPDHPKVVGTFALTVKPTPTPKLKVSLVNTPKKKSE